MTTQLFLTDQEISAISDAINIRLASLGHADVELPEWSPIRGQAATLRGVMDKLRLADATTPGRAARQ